MRSEFRQQRILEAVLSLEERLLENPSVESLAEVAELSPYHFSRAFRKLTGESPAAYGQRLRLELAANWLMFTNDPAVEIAVAVGYDSREGFARAFRRQMGMTPEEFRAASKHFRDKIQRRLRHFVPLKVRIVELPPRRMAFLRSFRSTTLDMLATWWRFLKICRAHPELSPKQFLNVAHDEDFVTKRRHQRCDVGCEIDLATEPPAPLVCQTLSGGSYAVADFQGSVAQLIDAWNWLAFVWLPASGWQLRDLVLELKQQLGQAVATADSDKPAFTLTQKKPKRGGVLTR